MLRLAVMRSPRLSEQFWLGRQADGGEVNKHNRARRQAPARIYEDGRQRRDVVRHGHLLA
jgi:hypothetical protein